MGVHLHPLLQLHGALVVDDSAVQRMNAVEVLRQAGIHRVYEAADGLAGLEAIRSLFPPPALLVVDLEMPGMDGIEMLQTLATENYRPPVLIASATHASLVASVETMCRELGLPILGAFEKPFTAEVLQRALLSFDHILDVRQQHRRTETEISADEVSDALAAGQIQPHYQPKICLQTGQVLGLEALARWTSPSRGIVSPAAFIPVAEDNCLITALTLSMLGAVLPQSVQWQHQGFTPSIAVNLSALSLTERNFVDEVIKRTREAGVAPEKIVIEVTESALISDMGAGLGALGRLRLKGFGLSMDDYGTGFSTTQQLSRLPLTELKIDRSFVSNAPDKASLRTILASVVRMGLDLGLNTLAEGVETESELRLLQSLGCQQVQGFLLARPMPGDAVLPWLEENGERVRALVAAGSGAV
ncbi:EAL domain-containing response regulator [Uliginosibacterium sp. 31-16]|uniref:EAL domain-containing response regulator n=1 Tax=Uliginosibacterium sp. 31-16 TaxID=3068315 RepID=UPI00273F5BDF|nr:EAL domain-containing response regulator [Uliginosibacterium sp. 31-16]MDP5240256.1 EAL domain-containing response regulator [Uliginosibacterium sp. 31-16]